MLCAGVFSMNGIDVSSYQGRVDWAAVRRAGKDFSILRAGFGNMAKQKDQRFDENARGALAAGVAAGAYWFSYAVSEEEARREAAGCREVLSPYWGRLTFPIYYDYEYATEQYVKQQTGREPTRAERTAVIEAFLDEIEKAGYRGGVYTNRDYITNKLDMNRLRRFELWLADYSSRQPDPRAGLRQTASDGSVSGISGAVDLDVSYKDYPAILRAEGKNGLEPEKNWVSDTTSTVEIAPCGVYTVKITGEDIGLVAGTPGVVCLHRCRREGEDTFWHVIGIGEAGQETGIYPAAGGPRIFIARIS